MTTTNVDTTSDLASSFSSFSTDQQLALLWFIYKETGKSITPAAPGASTAAPAIAEGLFSQVLALTHEEQLQVQRDLVEHKNSLISREYGALSDTTRLLFWYLLAQGMDRTEIIPMPGDYSLEPEASEWLQQLQPIDQGEQITVLRNIVANMGVDPNSSPHDEATGL
jgi:hypothetical protein